MFQSNVLQQESSIYLLQHQNNPVWWQTWNNLTLQYAQKNNKLLIISIGYSSCHWCHVMEHECFENAEIAKLMNNHFVSIKVDREERPDLDTIYMNALQTMGISSGWPLNIVALPNGKPFFGGTYFPQNKWIAILHKIITIHTQKPNELVEIANNVSRRLQLMDSFSDSNYNATSNEDLQRSFAHLLQMCDRNWGGFSKAPKFPIPNTWNTILQFSYYHKDKTAQECYEITLNRMLQGGIFDVVLGGFSRYSVDPYWKVPHFEKMLYDNAQLLSLYANAYKITLNRVYKEVIKKTIHWLLEEMYHHEKKYFYAATDADSEREEGSYYVWKTQDLKEILEHRYDFFQTIFNTENFGLWKENKNILFQLQTDEELAYKMGIEIESYIQQKNECLEILKTNRNKRQKPAIDTKCVTSWNALIISGLCDTYQAFSEEKYLHLAEENFSFLWKNYLQNHQLSHCIYTNNTLEQGFLEDYAFLIQAAIKLYESTFNPKYISISKQLTEQTIQLFYHKKNQLFVQKSLDETFLITDIFPVIDSVEPSGNAIMCENLFKLSKIFSSNNYLQMAENMILRIQDKALEFPANFTQWLSVMLYSKKNLYEVIVIGENCATVAQEINKAYIPNKIIVGSSKEEYLEIMKNRYVDNETFIYLCKENTCLMPEQKIENVIKKIQL